MCGEIAELLDCSIGNAWYSVDYVERKLKDGRTRLLVAEGGPVLPEAKFKGRPWPFKLRLPLPSRELLKAMKIETDNLPREAPPGPIASAWLERVEEWIWNLKLFVRGTRRRVCGVWRELYAHWVQLLKALPKKRAKRTRIENDPGGDRPPMGERQA